MSAVTIKASLSPSAILLMVLSLMLLSSTVAPAQESEITKLLSEMPRGDDDMCGDWLFSNALRIKDGQVAYELMSIITDDYSGRAHAMARLWKVRYHMAANELRSARHELSQLIDTADVDRPWEPEARYWRTLLTNEGGPDPSRSETGIPPWTIMTHLAGIGDSEQTDRSSRRALALEGVATRWGLVGPWIWRLLSSDHPTLNDAAIDLFERSGDLLTGAPSIVDIQRMIEVSRFRGALDPRGHDDDLSPDFNWPEGLPDDSQPDISHVMPPANLPPDPDVSYFAVQVGAFLNGNAARALTRELASFGFTAYCREPENDDPLFRVRVGPSRSLAIAESLGMALGDILMLPYQIVEERTHAETDSSDADQFQMPVFEEP